MEQGNLEEQHSFEGSSDSGLLFRWDYPRLVAMMV
jgi:hypothetical protein